MKVLRRLSQWMLPILMMAVTPQSAVAFIPSTPHGSATTKLALQKEDRERYWRQQSKTLLVSCWVAFSLLAAPIAAEAKQTSVFTNDYADPFHPLCERHIRVSKDMKTFHYSGTAVGPKDDPVRRGCTAEEVAKYGLRQGAFDGLLLSETQISAGDGIHEGVWEPANTAKTNLGFEGVDGIRWNDGNKWVVLDQLTK